MTSNVFAVDMGGTRMKAAVIDGSGQAVQTSVSPTPHRFADALDVAVGLAKSSGAKLEAVGLAVPGLVDADGKVIDLEGKLDGIVGVDIGQQLSSALGVPAVIANDAIAFATGEASYGSGRGLRRVVAVTIGTGIGIAVISDGKPVPDGPLGGGIMGGFMPISGDTSGPTDSTGRHGTIEALCSAPRILDAAKLEGGEFEDVAQVFAAYRSGDDAAINGIARYRQSLETALVALAHAHAPEAIILGGGPLQADSPLLDGLEERVNARLYGSYRTRLRRAELGDAAALIGLAHLARSTT